MSVKNLLKSLIPQSLELPVRYKYLKLSRRLDFELLALQDAKVRYFRAIDVGANIGIYSYGFSQFCERVESFEPMPGCTSMLEAFAARRGNISVHNVGLSNQTGSTTLYIPHLENSPIPNIGLASFIDPGGSRDALNIRIARLDDYTFTNVGVIKVDVEGHELEVFQGAVETITREKPILLVEIEQRHLHGRTIADVFHFILGLGYSGGFFLHGQFFPLSNFSHETHQKPFLDNVYSENYVNNFIFKPIS